MHERPFHCLDCRVRFASKEELVSHGTLGICKQNRTCYVCGELFSSPKNLKDHLVDFHRGQENSNPSEAVAKELEFHLAKIEEDKKITDVSVLELMLLIFDNFHCQNSILHLLQALGKEYTGFLTQQNTMVTGPTTIRNVKPTTFEIKVVDNEQVVESLAGVVEGDAEGQDFMQGTTQQVQGQFNLY